jgi:hypothetical protein
MRSADHDGHAATAEFPGETVGMKSGRRRGCNTHEIYRHIESHRLDNLVPVRDHVLPRR